MFLSLLSFISANNPSGAVDTVRMSLEVDSSFWFRLVKYSGYAVAFGCLLEAPETFVTIKRWWLLRFREEEKEETSEEKRSWIIPAAALGLIIIVLGIVAETYFEGRLSDVESDLRTHESEKITEAEGESTAAIRESGAAEDSSARAKTAADAAESKGKEASKEAVDAAHAAEFATRSAKEAETRVHFIEKYADSIVASVNSRRIDRKRFLSTLAGKPKGTAEIWYEPGDGETWEYAFDIAGALGPGGAGWVVTEPQVLPRKELPESYSNATSLLDILRIDAMHQSIAIAGGKPFDPSNPQDGLWQLLNQAVASIEGQEIIRWGGVRQFIPNTDSHFIIVVGHHRIDALRTMPPWQNLVSETTNKIRANKRSTK